MAFPASPLFEVGYEDQKDQWHMATFVCQERLQWLAPSTNTLKPDTNSMTIPDTHIKPESSIPFGHRNAYKILCSDWPYAVPSEVSPLVGWLKTPFEHPFILQFLIRKPKVKKAS